MDVKRLGSDHLVFTEDGVASARPMLLIVAGCIAAVAVAAFFGGSFLSLAVVLIVGGFILSMLWCSAARTAAVFDRERGTLAITHTRGGAIVDQDDVALADISQVIVEPSGGGKRTGTQQLFLRPSVLAGDRIVPLTYRSFEGGGRPVEIAEEIRDFLGLPRVDILHVSVQVLARHGDRIQPVVRLARLGLGLGRLEAAEMVTRLRRDPSQP